MKYLRVVRCGLRGGAMLAAGFLLLMALNGAAVAAAGSGGDGESQAAGPHAGVQGQNRAQNSGNDTTGGLVIDAGELPQTYLHGPYHFRFSAHGDHVPPVHWSVQSGALPPGIKLSDDGTLTGEAQRTGEFQFAVAVKDSNVPWQALQKEFVIKVMDALTVAWKVAAHVNNNRIEGSVEVTNLTREDMDLTFDTKAVAENGRATEIGYQHFPLRRGTIGMALPFGETLPNGGYVVYVTVVGEVAARRVIYRQLLQTPGPLHVEVEP